MPGLLGVGMTTALHNITASAAASSLKTEHPSDVDMADEKVRPIALLVASNYERASGFYYAPFFSLSDVISVFITSFPKDSF